MNKYLPLFLLLAASACGTVRTLPVQDSTRVEVRTEVKTVHDTAFVELPVIVERVSTLDTASVLENKYAKSAASVSDGVLTHNLETKPVKEPAIVQKQIVYKDSIIVKEVDVDHYIEMPAELTPWQSFKIKLGGYAFALIILLIVCAAIYFVSHLKPFKL